MKIVAALLLGIAVFMLGVIVGNSSQSQIILQTAKTPRLQTATIHPAANENTQSSQVKDSESRQSIAKEENREEEELSQYELAEKYVAIGTPESIAAALELFLQPDSKIGDGCVGLACKFRKLFEKLDYPAIPATARILLDRDLHGVGSKDIHALGGYIETLFEKGNPEQIDRLIQIMKSSLGAPALAVASYTFTCKDRSYLPQLLSIAKTHPNFEIRKYILGGISTWKDEEAYRTLHAFCFNAEQPLEIRQDCYKALGSNIKREQMDYFLEPFYSQNETDQRIVLKGISVLSDYESPLEEEDFKKAAMVIKTALQSIHLSVRWDAIQLLRNDSFPHCRQELAGELRALSTRTESVQERIWIEDAALAMEQ